MAGFRVAVVGATGLVGRTIVQILEERAFPISELVLLASPRSAGSSISFRATNVITQVLDEASFSNCDFVFFSAGAHVSREFAPLAALHAELVIDNSSAFRTQSDVPLVVPEVNGGLVAGRGAYTGIVANPNCSTVQMVVTLKPLHDVFGLEQVIVSTYQAVSGTGATGVRALEHELKTGAPSPNSPYPYPIAHNVLPHIADFDEDGWSAEEHKMIVETRKILSLPSLAVVPTTVRVPVRVGHSEMVYARFARRLDLGTVRRLLQQAPGVVLEDNPQASLYPLAVHAEGRDEVFVGRLRRDSNDEHALVMWVVADNLRKGAATNAVQIAEVWLAGNQAESGRRYA